MTVELACVESMQRLAEFVEHIVGHVHGRRDRSHPGQQQSPLHPPGSDGSGIDTHDLAQSEPRSTGLGLDRHGPGVTGDLGGHRARRIHIRKIEAARQLTGQAAHREGVPAIRCHVQLDHRIIETQNDFGIVAGLRSPFR